MNLVKKDIKYLNKDFGQFRQNLINFAKQYFPNTYNDFNESSPGMMFIEMASYVGDVLSYYADQQFRESILTSAQEESNVLLLSQMFGYKPKLNAPAIVDIDIFQLVPAIGTGTNARPDYRYALSFDANVTVSTINGINFRTVNPVDFNFSSPADPTDVSVYQIDNGTGNVQFYLLKKTVRAISGTIKTVSYTFGDPKPYDKISLPDTNVLDIISITDSEGNPWYQVDYLAQDTVFEDVSNISFNDPELSVFRSSVPYILKLQRTARRFVTRVRSNYQTEIQFGSGISSDADEEIIPNPKNIGNGLEYLERITTSNIDPTNFLYTSTYGIAPNNTTLTVRYAIGGGVADNVGSNTITIVDTNSIIYRNEISNVDLSFIKTTLAVTNPAAAVGGAAKDSIDNIRQNAMANFAAQNRAITREDYIARCYSMPAKYGSIEKAYIIQDTQQDTNDRDYPRDTISNPLALNLYTLSYDSNKNFTTPNTAIRENLRTYLSNYRMLTDAINIKTAYIVNIGIEFDIVARPNVNSNEAILQCVNKLKQLFNNDRMQINGSINVSNIISELDSLSFVQSIAKFEITNLFDTNNGYSGNVYDIASATKNNIIYPSLDPCIFEIKYPNTDIKGRVVKP
jgi:hypothetical protein